MLMQMISHCSNAANTLLKEPRIHDQKSNEAAYSHPVEI